MAIFKKVQKIFLIITIIVTILPIANVANAQWTVSQFSSLNSNPWDYSIGWNSPISNLSLYNYTPSQIINPMYPNLTNTTTNLYNWISQDTTIFSPWKNTFYQTFTPSYQTFSPFYQTFTPYYQMSTPSYQMFTTLYQMVSSLSFYSPIKTKTPKNDTLAEKPAIYLYPEEDTYVTVELDINGELTISDPDYQEGWYVFVTKDGTITDINGLEYDYLFWEGELRDDLLSLPDTGWIIAQENLEAWFDVYLNVLGLVEKEIEQFKEYWLEQLQDSPYYEIRLVDQNVLNSLARLGVRTNNGSCPDTIIRIMFHFRGRDEYEYIKAPVIVTPERKGFVVVEWGGIFD